jgi:hypothetical protein
MWYSDHIEITGSKLHGIKALRECSKVTIDSSSIISPEFGWSVHGLKMTDTSAESEYFLMRSTDIVFDNVSFKGKYSFQYTENVEIRNSRLDTKDAFWHAKNVIIRNSVIKGEYLGWYCEDVTFENCTISGTQPFCYCKNLKLIDCEMLDADLAFEKSDVEATITTSMISIKNPKSGTIIVPDVGEIIMDDKNACGIVKYKD